MYRDGNHTYYTDLEQTFRLLSTYQLVRIQRFLDNNIPIRNFCYHAMVSALDQFRFDVRMGMFDFLGFSLCEECAHRWISGKDRYFLVGCGRWEEVGV